MVTVADDIAREDGDVGPAPASATAGTGASPRRIHKLRDLDRRGRWVAAVIAVALVLMPVGAFLHFASDWVPVGDPALMAMRALDVGTVRTPMIGQPSSSRLYVDGVGNVNHLGPLHFYLLAGPVRLLGATYGMMLVSVLITGACVLLSAWAIHRQLGPVGGLVGAVALGLVTFTTGASSLVNPISSSIAGYPVLATMVLLWCLLCGDLRLLTLTVAVGSFAAQQHLSSLASLVVAVGLVALLLARPTWRRWRGADAAARRTARRWAAGTAGVAAVLWSPVVAQELLGDRGNLTALVDFASHDDRPTLGYDTAFRQVVHVVGVPPLLGQLSPNGYWLLEEVSVVRWVTAAAVAALVVAVGLRRRRSCPPLAAAAVMVGVLAIAGLVNGASVPLGYEQGRIAFYHWTWPLTLFAVLTLGVAAVTWLAGTGWARSRPRLGRTGGVALAVAVIAVPAVVSPTLDRRPNTLVAASTYVSRSSIDELGDEVLEHREELGEPTVVIVRGAQIFEGFDVALSLDLMERGVDVRMNRSFGADRFVDAHRMVDRETVESGLVLIVESPGHLYPHDPPGELIASTDTRSFDLEAYQALVEQLEEGGSPVLGDDLDRALEAMDDDYEALLRGGLLGLPDNAEFVAVSPPLLDALREHPMEHPTLDPEMLDRVLSTVGDGSEFGFTLEVYLLDRDELLAFAGGREVGRPPDEENDD